MSRGAGAPVLLMAGVGVAGCLVGIGATLVFTMDPGQAAATRAAPKLPVPTVQLVSQELRDETTVPCSYEGVQLEVKPPRSAGRYRARVVTSVDVKPGAKLSSGTPVVSVSGRPVIAFVSPMSFYRDLSVGDKGVDVKALEQGLVAAGKLTKADRSFGEDTARAMASVNQAAGLGSSGIFRVDSAWSVPAGSTITGVSVHVGDTVGKSTVLATADTSGGVWSCELPAGVRVAAGDELPLSGHDGKATVEKVSAGADPDEADAGSMTVTAPGVDPDDDLTVRVVAAASHGKVLTVPVGALFTDPSGGSQLRAGADGAAIPVTVGVVAGGWAEVSGDGLKAGDAVQLGATR
ncbi:MAG: hypothetical protein QM619_01705 [Micropruina sp.]|uniref:hypothetical protein n=1 Tax=Micropruina sp. TaxID=2737536 RepID=UPI0039E5192A